MKLHLLTVFLGIIMITSTFSMASSHAFLPDLPDLPEQSQAPKAFASKVRVIEGDNIIAHARALLTTVDDPATHLTDDGYPYDGVAKLSLPNTDGNTYLCSGALLPTGKHVLTAAHCVTDESGNDALLDGGTATFARDSEPEIINIIDYKVHDNYDGDYIKGNDIAILILQNPASDEIVRYNYDRLGNAVDQVVTKVGYGVGGYFNSGWMVCIEHDPCEDGDTLVHPSGYKRNGLNEYDALADVMYQALGLNANSDYVPEAIYQFDSDNYNPSNDAFGFFFGISDTGLSTNEVMSAPGDSGGPSLVDTTNDGIDNPDTVVGVASYGITLEFSRGPPPRTSDCTTEGRSPILDSSCGEFAGDTRVSVYSDWIYDILESSVVDPDNLPPEVNDDSAETDEDIPVDVDVTANDDDTDGTIDTTSVVVTSGPSDGSTSVDPITGVVTYTPDADFYGSDSFVYSVADDDGATDTATVSITINSVNDAPTADAGPNQTVPDSDSSGAENVTLDGSGSSDDGNITSYSWEEGGIEIETGVSPIISFSVGVHEVTLIVTDNDGITDSDTVTITVETSDDGPSSCPPGHAKRGLC